ncbi:MAG: PKD domain-containing protein, partial [Halobacterium sp.]
MKSESLIAVALLVTAATTPAVAAANEAPLADAGLDQTVTRGTTVYLDGTGSRDPDGSIERYQWTITAESGDATNATSPQCTTCERTQFQAEATGTYRVTLEVTDDDGATTTDTLFVTVEPGTSPTASLSGPSRTTTAESAEFTVDVDAGAAPLDRLVWKQDGNRVATEPLSGTAATSSRTFNFPTTGTHDVSAVVVDDDGQRDTASKSIAVTAPASVATPSDPFGSPNDGSDANTTAPVTVLGPQVVTGGGNLTADYKLSDGATGRWLQDGEQVARGATTERRFSAGIHQLYATTDTGAATFADGSRTVVADPAPELPVLDVRNGTTPAVDLQATDDFGNIQSVTVSVDGQPVETLTSGTVQSRQTGKSLSTVEYLQNLAPGTHVVSVYARDARGQAAAAIRTVEVPGPPEVVSAGFVQDGPLDQ